MTAGKISYLLMLVVKKSLGIRQQLYFAVGVKVPQSPDTEQTTATSRRSGSETAVLVIPSQGGTVGKNEEILFINSDHCTVVFTETNMVSLSSSVTNPTDGKTTQRVLLCPGLVFFLLSFSRRKHHSATDYKILSDFSDVKGSIHHSSTALEPAPESMTVTSRSVKPTATTTALPSDTTTLASSSTKIHSTRVDILKSQLGFFIQWRYVRRNYHCSPSSFHEWLDGSSRHRGKVP